MDAPGFILGCLKACHSELALRFSKGASEESLGPGNVPGSQAIHQAKEILRSRGSLKNDRRWRALRHKPYGKLRTRGC